MTHETLFLILQINCKRFDIVVALVSACLASSDGLKTDRIDSNLIRNGLVLKALMGLYKFWMP